MRNLILLSFAAIAIQAQENSFADLFNYESVELTAEEEAQFELCNDEETPEIAHRCTCMKLTMKASGLNPDIITADSGCLDGPLPEVEDSLIVPEVVPEVLPEIVPEEVQEVIIDETTEVVEQIVEVVTEEVTEGICDPEDPDCESGRSWITWVVMGLVISLLIAYLVYYLINGTSLYAINLLQSEVFNLALQDYNEKLSMNLAFEF